MRTESTVPAKVPDEYTVLNADGSQLHPNSVFGTQDHMIILYYKMAGRDPPEK